MRVNMPEGAAVVPRRAPVTRGRAGVLDESFDRVFREHYRPIYRFLARRVGPDLGEQLAAEVFATAFRKRDAYVAEHDTPRPWLYGIAHGLLANERRRERRHLDACARLAVPRPGDDPAATAASRVDAEQVWPIVAAQLAALNDGERDALLLYAWSELTYAQIAEVLGIPVGTVRSRISHARSKLTAVSGPGAADQEA